VDQVMRVLSYNIHKGFDPGNRRFVLAQLKQAVRRLGADLVFLQEVQGQSESELGPQFEFLADELWPHYAYGKNAVYSSGHHGNAILSRFPILFHENIDVSTNRLESRGLLHVILDLEPEGPSRIPLHAICVHLGLREADRRSQLERLCERIHSHVPDGEPLVIAGDFNDWRLRATAVLKEKLGVSEVYHSIHGEHARTFPSWLPALRLDRIYCRGLETRHARCLTGFRWRLLSDHTPLLADLA
jgi:endonuclease/exonuclease/phosphatase family metal-dependent hydrolase